MISLRQWHNSTAALRETDIANERERRILYGELGTDINLQLDTLISAPSVSQMIIGSLGNLNGMEIAFWL